MQFGPQEHARSARPDPKPLATEPKLPESVQSVLSRVLTETPLGRQISNIRIWAPPQRRPSLTRVILYSNVPDLIGRRFEQTLAFKRAASGLVVKTLNPPDLDGTDKSQGVQVLQIFTPIYEHGTARVIAIAEFHQKTDALQASIRATRALTALIVGGSTFGMLALLFGIVRQGSRTIAMQQVILKQRVGELSNSLMHNQELRQNLIKATRRTGETNERLLRRVGAELHDGPAQLIGLALLRLDAIHPDDASQSRDIKAGTFEIIRGALADAMNEIRSISSGIAPPHLKDVALKSALELAVKNHEKRTGTLVARDIGEFPEPIPSLLKICLYRFTQEGLNNAFKHAAGRGQKVVASYHRGIITVAVSDAGGGSDSSELGVSLNSEALGLAGLRDRVESLDGELEFQSIDGSGTSLVAYFNLELDRSDTSHG